jgi:hypothetical protein
MATIDWRRAGEDARRLNYNPTQADAYAKTLNGGNSLSYRDQQLFSQGYIGTGSGSSQSSTTTSGGGTANKFQQYTGGLIGAVDKAIATQEKQGYMPNLKEEYISASDALSVLLDKNGNLVGATDLLKNVTNAAFNGLETYFRQQTELLGVVNQKMGLTGQMSEDLREELTMTNPELIRLGIGFDELARSAETLVSNSGRFISLNRESWKEAGLAASAYVGTLSDLVGMFPAFEKIGIGAGDVSEEIEAVGQRSLSLGLQSQKTVQDLGTNLSKLNEYGFKGGVQGMAEMVRKSTEFRMNMQSVFSIADKVFNPEGAIEVAANLQAIGGAIGDFNDPLKLMYMATNDVEGLQDALVGVAGSLATYNDEQGRFEITGVNLRKAKALATELGVSYEELASGAIAAAERSSAATSLLSSGLDLDDEQKRFLTNISTMKDGQMTIQLNSDRLREIFGQNEIALENLTDDQVRTLTQYQDEFKKLSPEDIVRKQATDVENIMRDVNFLAAVARIEGGTAVKGLADMTGLGKIKDFTKEFADENAPKIKGSISGYIDDMKKEKLQSSMVEPQNKPSQPTSTNQQNNLSVTVTTDVNSDKLGQSLVSNPEWLSKLSTQNMGDYTVPSIFKTSVG